MLDDFYPTPKSLIRKMVEGVNFDEISTVLEPSAGKGDICEYVRSRIEYQRVKPTIDAIEINPDLQHILRGKGFNLIQDDFLSFDTSQVYDLIVANFPFSNGDAHLMRALQLLQKNGGRLICLVNAETLRNPHTKLRESLAIHLEQHGATTVYLADQFLDAERPTAVEVALVDVSIEKRHETSFILDQLIQARPDMSDFGNMDQLTERDFLKAMIGRYRLECTAGVRLIDEYNSLCRLLLPSLPKKGEKEDSFRTAMLKLTVNTQNAYGSSRSGIINDYLPLVRRKYWDALVHDPRYSGQYTTNIQEDLDRKLTELVKCEFNRFNIDQLARDLASQLAKGVEKAILDLFDEFSRKFAWDESIHQKNVHYYNGWKTNQCWKIRNKVIVPMNGISANYSSKYKFEYRIHEKLNDMIKVFNYLSADKVDVPQLVRAATETSENRQNFTNVDFRYFTATFYKKHTCHIRFHDKDLLDKFNIFGSQRKGWLPPSYGKAAYDDMTREDQAIVDDFQGREAYEKVMLRPDYFLVEDAKGLLGAGTGETE